MLKKTTSENFSSFVFRSLFFYYCFECIVYEAMVAIFGDQLSIFIRCALLRCFIFKRKLGFIT